MKRKTKKIVMNALATILIAIVILPISIEAHKSLSIQFGSLFTIIGLVFFWSFTAIVLYLLKQTMDLIKY